MLWSHYLLTDVCSCTSSVKINAFLVLGYVYITNSNSVTGYMGYLLTPWGAVLCLKVYTMHSPYDRHLML
jgi:hypothetical protein